MSFITIIVFSSLLTVGNSARKEFLGCYQDNYTIKLKVLTEAYTETDCVDNCYKEYYPYALFRGRNSCACSHYIGELKNQSRCEDFCYNCDIRNQIRDVYFTGFKIIGPPVNLIVSNVSDTQLHVSWNPPELAKNLQSYAVNAKVLKTYSSVPLKDMSWKFSNDTFYNDLSSLHPGTHYNISVRAISDIGPGIEAYQIIETKIGEPSDTPEIPVIVSRDKSTMKIRIKPVINDNGPITSYLVVVSNKSSVQTVDTDNLMSVTRALNDGLSYYITAEIPSEDLNDTFEVGNGQVYGQYYNAPLSPSASYDISLGVKSRKDDVETRSFSAPIIPNLTSNAKEEIFMPDYLLIVLISVVCVAMCLIIIVFIIVKYRLGSDYRRHSNDTQELRVRSSVINVENHGYIAEEQPAQINYYEELRKQVWMIPHQSLKVDYIRVLGQGKFGHIYKASLEKDLSSTDVLVYSIADRMLTPEQKQEMLKDLGILIKTGKHKNVLEFIGTCENLDSICVTMEYNSLTLKEYLLASRVQSKKSYTTLNEMAALQIAIFIAGGLHYLHTRNIIHKQICARHVAMCDDNTPKIMGYGLATYYKDSRSVNCTRWTSREVLNGDKHSMKSDVWSLACLIWEICALGGTPYASIGNYEVADRIIRGCTLPQLDCMDPEFYQILLNCWQISTDERPHAISVQQTLEFYLSDSVRDYINFAKIDDDEFQYERHNMEQELNYPMI